MIAHLTKSDCSQLFCEYQVLSLKQVLVYLAWAFIFCEGIIVPTLDNKQTSAS